MLPGGTDPDGVTVPSVIVNVSFPSTIWSPLMVTAMFFVSPAVPLKVSGLAVTSA